MPMITWTYRPAETVAPGVIQFGWSLASPDLEVRWYTEPLSYDYPSEYVLGATQASVTIDEPGIYVFHLEAKDPDGKTEERVVLFEVAAAKEGADHTETIQLTTLPKRRALPTLRTQPCEVPFRGVPDSREQNRWVQNVIEDLRALHDASRQLQEELELRAKVSMLEEIAKEHRLKNRMSLALAHQTEPVMRKVKVLASDFVAGLPEGIDDEGADALVDPVWGEIAPALYAEPENKIGWVTPTGLELPASLTIEALPEIGTFTQTDPTLAINGRPETAWVREIQVRPGEAANDVVYRLTIPSGVTAQRVANRLDIACLPAYGVDVRYVKLFDGTTWELVYGWPRAQTSTGTKPLPITKVGPLRLRFPDQVVAGIEVALRPMRSLISQGASQYIVGLYHLGLWYDPIQWGVHAKAHTVIPSERFPAGGVRILSAAPITAHSRRAEGVQASLYRVTPTGGWIPMKSGEALLGEGLGVVLEISPEADIGWSQVVGGVIIDYQLV